MLGDDDGNDGGSGGSDNGCGGSSVWANYYAKADLRAEIQRDLDRLFVDGLDDACVLFGRSLLHLRSC